MRKRKKTIQKVIRVSDTDIPVTLIIEPRTNLRFSIAVKGAYLRIPSAYRKKDIQKAENEFSQWMVEAIRKKPGILQRFKTISYHHDQQLKVGQRTYKLQIFKELRKTSRATIRDKVITIKMPLDLNQTEQTDVIRKLISRSVAKDYEPYFIGRVYYFNDRYFNKPLKGIRFKNNHSNWGSCSSKGNLNFSTRLFFAPPDVIDYVIVHELAHLIEFNHSPAFWSIVEDILPDYRDKVNWLNKMVKTAASEYPFSLILILTLKYFFSGTKFL